MKTLTDKTLTAANSVILVRANGYNSNWVALHGFQADNIFSAGEAKIGETVMGADGYQSGAFTPYETDWTVSLMPTSPSRDYLHSVAMSITNNQETYPFEMQISLPSIKERYNCKGFMVSANIVPSGKKILDGGSFTFRMGEISVESIA